MAPVSDTPSAETIVQSPTLFGFQPCRASSGSGDQARAFSRVYRREALLQAHVVAGTRLSTLPDGTPWKMSACVVVRIENGLITRLDEYIDSAESGALRVFGR